MRQSLSGDGRGGRPATRWRFGQLAAAAVVVVGIYPLVALARGAGWNGLVPYLEADEHAYAAYANALVQGRPRRGDPYAGRDDSPNWGRAGGTLDTRSVVFTPDQAVADFLPAVAPQPVLWAPHSFVFAGIGQGEEDGERALFAQFLHYAGVAFDGYD